VIGTIEQGKSSDEIAEFAACGLSAISGPRARSRLPDPGRAAAGADIGTAREADFLLHRAGMFHIADAK